MGDHIAVVQVQRTVKEAAVIGDDLQLAIHRFPNSGQGVEVAGDGFGEDDSIGPHRLPVLCHMDILDASKGGDADLEVGNVSLGHLKEEGEGHRHHIDPGRGDPV